jgi:hypothetical protein
VDGGYGTYKREPVAEAESDNVLIASGGYGIYERTSREPSTNSIYRDETDAFIAVVFSSGETVDWRRYGSYYTHL